MHGNIQWNDITSRFPLELVCEPTTCAFQEASMHEPRDYGLESAGLESAYIAPQMHRCTEWCALLKNNGFDI